MDVQESWWHRLLIVAMTIAWLIVAVPACFIGWGAAKETVARYSWQVNTWKPSKSANKCEVGFNDALGDAYMYCGEFTDPSKVLDDLVAQGWIDKKQIPSPRTKLSDGRALEGFAKEIPLWTYWDSVINFELLLKAVGAVVFVLGIAFVILLGIFKLILFIAHGRGVNLVR